jgi:hypothetical protein
MASLAVAAADITAAVAAKPVRAAVAQLILAA